MKIAPEIKMLNPLNIDTHAGTQARVSIRSKTVDKYADCMKAGDPFPPLEVYAERGSKRYILADGFTRLAAHIRVKKDTPIACNVYEGGIWQAKVHAAGSNHEHGEPRTDKDLHNAIKMLLLDGNSDGKSDSVIGDMARCDRRTVAKLREKLIIGGKLEPTNKRTGKDGRTVDVSDIGGKTKDDESGKSKDSKDKGKSKPQSKAGKGNGSSKAQKSQNEHDREEILNAIATLRLAPFDGKDAYLRYNLQDSMKEIRFAHQFLLEIIEANEQEPEQSRGGDDAAFLATG